MSPDHPAEDAYCPQWCLNRLAPQCVIHRPAEDAREAGDGLDEIAIRDLLYNLVAADRNGKYDGLTMHQHVEYVGRLWKQDRADLVREAADQREREVGQRLLGQLLIERQTRPISLETVEWLNELLGRIEAEFRALAGPLDEDE